MTEYVEGKTYRIVATGRAWHDVKRVNGLAVFENGRFEYQDGEHVIHPPMAGYEYDVVDVTDAIDPEHYQFPGGAQVIDISEHLTANAAQALQYIARSSRIDGRNKGNTIEDLTKAIWFLDREVDRLKEAQ